MEVKTGRRTIYIPTGDLSGLYRLLAMRGESQMSGTIDTAVGRYLTTIANSLPVFSDAEWCLAFEALMSTWVSDETSVLAIGQDVVEAIEYDQLDEKWGVDADAFGVKLRGLTYAELQAVAEMVELFPIFRQTGTYDNYSAIIADMKRHFRPERSEGRRDERQSTRMFPEKLN